jgi:hypothetical protein
MRLPDSRIPRVQFLQPVAKRHFGRGRHEWRRSASESSAAATWARPMRWRCRPWRGVRHRPAPTARDGLRQARRERRTPPRRLRLRRARRRLAGAGCQPAGRGRHHRLAAGSTHRAIADAAFALGKPVLCEKPMGASAGRQPRHGRSGGQERRGQYGRFQLYPHPGQPVRPAIDRRGRNRRHHLVPRRTHRGFLCRPASPGELAHRRPCQRHHGRSRPAHDQRSTCARRPDPLADRRDRNRAREPPRRRGRQ